jgi:hypothetical protein
MEHVQFRSINTRGLLTLCVHRGRARVQRETRTCVAQQHCEWIYPESTVIQLHERALSPYERNHDVRGASRARSFLWQFPRRSRAGATEFNGPTLRRVSSVHHARRIGTRAAFARAHSHLERTRMQAMAESHPLADPLELDVDDPDDTAPPPGEDGPRCTGMCLPQTSNTRPCARTARACSSADSAVTPPGS